MIHHQPHKRLHEDDTNVEHDLLHPDSIKRPRVISPRSPFSDSTTIPEVFPDVVELPEDIHQRRKHTLDTLSEEDTAGYTSEDVEVVVEGHPAHHHTRQRRRVEEEPFREEEELEEDSVGGHTVMIPSDIIRKIPEVVLESTQLHPTNIIPNAISTAQPSGLVIEEIPYNPLALIPYSPPPKIFFPGLSSGAYPQRDSIEDEMLTSTQEEEGEEADDENQLGGARYGGDAMEVLPMLTPPDAGYMLGAWTGNTPNDNASCGDDETGDAMEE